MSLDHDPGVVDEDVDPAEPLDDVLHRRADRREDAEIGFDVRDPRMAVQRVVQRLALDDRNGSALLEEAVDDAAAYPASAAGHQRDLSLQLLHHVSSQLPTGLAPVTSTVSPAM